MRLFVICVFLAAASCHDAPAPPQRIEGPIPRKLCTEVKGALDSIAAQGGFDYKDNGEATIEQAAWLGMGEDQRDSVAHALGFHASCAAGRQNEAQEIAIRNDVGLVLMRRLVDTRVDPMTLLQQQGGGR